MHRVDTMTCQCGPPAQRMLSVLAAQQVLTVLHKGRKFKSVPRGHVVPTETQTSTRTSVPNVDVGPSVRPQLGHPRLSRAHTKHPAGCQQQGGALPTHRMAICQSVPLRTELGAGHA